MLVKLIFLCVICCCINSNVFARSVIPHWKMHRTESGRIYCDYHETYHDYSYRYDPTDPTGNRSPRLLDWEIDGHCISLDSLTGEPKTYYEEHGLQANYVKWGGSIDNECYHHKGVQHDDCWRSHICLECGTVMVHGKFYRYGLFRREKRLFKCETCSDIVKESNGQNSIFPGNRVEAHNNSNKILCHNCNKKQYFYMKITPTMDNGWNREYKYYCSKHGSVEEKDNYCHYEDFEEKKIKYKEWLENVFFQVKQWIRDVYYRVKLILPNIWEKIKNWGRDASFAVKTYSQNLYDIDDMVSGVPQVIQPVDKIKLSEFVTNARQSRRRYYSCQSLERWGNMVLLQAVHYGYIYSVKYLLELGFDINGSYIDCLDPNYSYFSKDNKKISLLEYHLRTPYRNKHDFIKMYIFLLENGADLQKPFSDGYEPIIHLLALCNKQDDIWMWKLIPLSVAYGAKIDQELIDKINLTNEDFSMYVKNIIGRNIVKPNLVCEQRNKDLLLKLARHKINNYKTDLEVCHFSDYLHEMRYQKEGGRRILMLTSDQLKEKVKDGNSLNVLFVYPDSYIRNRYRQLKKFFPKLLYLSRLVERNNSETLEFLLANGWVLGCESYSSHRYIYDSDWTLWEFGVDITEEDINSAKDYEVWEKLVSAYKQQLCQFGENDIKKYKDKFYDLPNKATTTKKNNIKTLPEKNIVKKSNHSSTL